MKLLLTVVALVAVAHGAPTTQTMEIGASGVSGSLLNIPLVEIIVNMISNEAAVAPGTVNEPVIEAEPVIVVDDAQLPTPVIVVDQPEVNPIDVVAVNPAPAPVVVDQPEANPIDVVAVNPAPAPVVVDQPEVNPVDVIAVNPMPEPVVLPAPAPAEVVPEVVVPEPVVLPEPTPAEVAPEPVVLPEPAPAEVVVPEPTPVVVVPEPTPVEVAPTPAEVAEIAEVPAPEAEAAEGSSQIINVMLNFIFGASGSLSSVEVPANIIPQVVGAPRV